MIYELIDRYEALFIDAYGVLVDAQGTLQGASDFVKHLNQHNKNYLIVTNDASRTPLEISERFIRLGLQIKPEQVLCSGSLILDYFAAKELSGQRTKIMGTQASVDFALTAGAHLVDYEDDQFEVLVLADEAGYRFREALDHIVSQLFGLIDQGQAPKLILPNPDLIYPKTGNEYGITAGSIALMLEGILEQRYGNQAELKFDRLGKPEKWIFDAACRRTGTRDALMIGDQLHTDILGAQNSGIDSLLMLSGVTRKAPSSSRGVQPTFVIDKLSA